MLLTRNWTEESVFNSASQWRLALLHIQNDVSPGKYRLNALCVRVCVCGRGYVCARACVANDPHSDYFRLKWIHQH